MKDKKRSSNGEISISKRAISVALSILILCMPMFPVSARADVTEDGEWSYRELEDGTLEITRFNNYRVTEITVPAEINGKRVTRLGEAAFDKRTNLKKVVISYGIEHLGGDHLFSKAASPSLVTLLPLISAGTVISVTR